MVRTRHFTLLVGLLPALGPAPTLAQTILVQVVEAESLNPIPTAFVTLVDEEDHPIRSGLTDPTGRLLFVLQETGSFRMRAEMFGRGTAWSQPMTIGAEENAFHRFEMATEAIPLPEIRVESEQVCRIRPEDGQETARVWEEARKALTIQSWTDRERLYRFQVVPYEREMDRWAQVLLSETRKEERSLNQNPIVSLPAEELMEKGWVQRGEDGDLVYYGPDASVLLSGRFLESHCFRLTENEELPGRIGLTFEPIRNEGVSDIEGTLWLDRRTAHLRFLEYTYTNVMQGLARNPARGRIDFERLPNGAWIVRKWWIRIPRLALDPFLGRFLVRGMVEDGGEVTEVSPLQERRLARRPGGWLEGVVWDSTRSAPLPGARVVLFGSDLTTTTDSAGRFRFSELAEGRYNVAFNHPRLDTLGAFPSVADVRVRSQEGSRVRLAVPSNESIMASACIFRGQAPGSAPVVGTVRTSTTAQPIPRAQVTLRWGPPADQEGESPRRTQLRTFTDAAGRFLLCGAPTDRPVTAQATFLNRRSLARTISPTPGDHLVLALGIDLPPGLIIHRSGATIMEGGTGIQGVQGRIREPGSRAPIRRAEVVLRQTPGSLVVTGETGDRGDFRLRTPLAGTYTLEARALGYGEAVAEDLTVVDGMLTVLEIEMAPAPLELEPIVAVGESRPFQLEVRGFYEREERGFGYFVSPKDLEQWAPVAFGDLFQRIPGIEVSDLAGLDERLVVFYPSVTRGPLCTPTLYVDGNRTQTSEPGNGLAIGEVLDIADVEAVEWYPRPSTAPLVWQATGTGCGILAVWTKVG